MSVDDSPGPDIMPINDSNVEITPEHRLYVEVLILFLHDIEAACRILYDDICTRQKDLVMEAFRTKLTGQKYWENRWERKRLIKHKINLKHQMQLLEHELNHPWMREICSMANVRFSIIEKTANRMFRNEFRLHKTRSLADMRLATRIKKRCGRRPRR